jgi:hypothetical protein
MERYLSVLGFLLIFWASAALQVVFRPYAAASLHRMHVMSTSCLAATTFGALAVFAYEIGDPSAVVLRIVVVVVVLCINVMFVAWWGFKLIPWAKLLWITTQKSATRAWAACAPRVMDAIWGCRALTVRSSKAPASSA